MFKILDRQPYHSCPQPVHSEAYLSIPSHTTKSLPTGKRSFPGAEYMYTHGVTRGIVKHLLTSIAGLVHVNDHNLTTQILVFPCQTCSVYAMMSSSYTLNLYHTKVGSFFSEGQS